MRLVAVALMLMLMLPIAPVLAQDAKASEESVKQLFELMNTSSLLDNVMKQVDANARTALNQRLAGRALSDEQRRIVTDTQEKVQALVRDELNWAKLEPMMIQVYRDNLTQQDVDGMLKFYRSDSGQAFIKKMPAVTQEMMQKMQGRVQELSPKIKQLESDSFERMKATANPPQSPPPAPH